MRDAAEEGRLLGDLGDDLRVKGIGRDVENPQGACIYLSRRPTDDELRAIHEYLRIRDWSIPVRLEVQQ
jgi:hypothetical protein